MPSRVDALAPALLMQDREKHLLKQVGALHFVYYFKNKVTHQGGSEVQLHIRYRHNITYSINFV